MNLLFEYFPSLQKMYYHIMEFRAIYEQQNKCEAKSKMECWIDKSFDMEEKVINTSAQTIQYNLDNILNFFNHRNTNANAESFNSKIKLFRANLRGVTDTAFFLFRLKNLFA